MFSNKLKLLDKMLKNDFTEMNGKISASEKSTMQNF